MRKLLPVIATASLLLAASIASAADLPIRHAPPPLGYVPPLFSWNGLYIGTHIGGAWARHDWADTTRGVSFAGNSDGVLLGGARLGANAQFGSFVVGAEWDVGLLGGREDTGDGVLVPALGSTFRVSADNSWVTTLAARFGVALDRVLLYAKAGGGWLGNNDVTITNTTTGAAISGTGHHAASGLLLGAGLEWAFLPSWTFRAEYEYLGLGDRKFVVPAAAPFLAGDTFTGGNRSLQMVKVGINYLFNWNGPFAVRY